MAIETNVPQIRDFPSSYLYYHLNFSQFRSSSVAFLPRHEQTYLTSYNPPFVRGNYEVLVGSTRKGYFETKMHKCWKRASTASLDSLHETWSSSQQILMVGIPPISLDDEGERMCLLSVFTHVHPHPTVSPLRSKNFTLKTVSYDECFSQAGEVETSILWKIIRKRVLNYSAIKENHLPGSPLWYVTNMGHQVYFNRFLSFFFPYWLVSRFFYFVPQDTSWEIRSQIKKSLRRFKFLSSLHSIIIA
jgi:hypothetical protein